MPNDEFASQNAISAPDEIEDSQASDFNEILEQNERKRKVVRNQSCEGAFRS